jgi:hypothetical protein
MDRANAFTKSTGYIRACPVITVFDPWSGAAIDTSDLGRLIVVGTGITSISQFTVEAMAWIEAADIVCYVLADPITERWIVDHAKQTDDLSRLHRTGATRLPTYHRMAEILVEHARAGRTVVGVFYGHPGVFTSPSHWAIRQARGEGIPARMLAAVSAEDCLFADLGVDPGEGACQSFEATDMLIRGRIPSPDAHLIVWQVGVLGQMGLDDTGSGGRISTLVDYLCRFYPSTHPVTHYQAAQNVVCNPTADTVPLSELGDLLMNVTSTLYVPPVGDRDFDLDLADKVGLLGEQPEELADDGSVPDWYRPLSAQPSKLAEFISALSREPSLLDAFWQAPAPYLAAVGLDVIETWSILTRNQEWISMCARMGSGPAAAVAMGVAQTQDEALTFRLTSDGRLARPRR